MIQLTNQEASRLLKALIRLEAHEEGTATILLSDIVDKVEMGAVVWDCQLRVGGDLDAGKYNICQDVFEWIEYETDGKESAIVAAFVTDHPQGATETGQMTIGRFLSLT